MSTPRFVLVFDTETSGLPIKDGSDRDPPYILQLSFVMFDTTSATVVQEYNRYIRIGPHVQLSEVALEKNGITRKMCARGVLITTALRVFYDAYQRADLIVAHNLSFDRHMILYEIARHGEGLAKHCPHIHEMFLNDGKQTFCTMIFGKDICNIMTQPKERLIGDRMVIPRPFKKNPRLSELYEHLYGEVPDGLHDALVDTKACLNCYLKLTNTVSV